MFICSISGLETTVPVLSPKSNRIFDKTLISNYINENSSDPVNNQPLSIEELIPINLDNQINTTIKEPSKTSIPSLLSIFQNEWDSMSLELFQLRKQVLNLKKDLSLSLYKQDAAIKVATNALKEKEEFKSKLQQLSSEIGLNGGPLPTPTSTETDFSGLLQSARDELFQFNKSNKTKFPFDLKAELKIDGEEPVNVQADSIIAKLNKNLSKVAMVFKKSIQILNLVDSSIEYEYQFKGVTASTKIIQWTDNDSIMFSDGGHLLRFSNSDFLLSFNNPLKNLLQHPLLSLSIGITEKSIKLFDVTKNFNKEIASDSNKYTNVASLHQDGLLLALCTSKGSVIIFNLLKLEEELTIDVPKELKGYHPTNLLFSSNGYTLIIEYTKNKKGSLVNFFDLRKAQFQSQVNELPLEESGLPLSINRSATVLCIGDKVFKYLKKEKSWIANECELVHGDGGVKDVIVHDENKVKVVAGDGVYDLKLSN